MTFYSKYYIIYMYAFFDAKTCKEVIIIKLDKVIKKEVTFIGIWVLIFSALMEAVFLATGFWDYTVLLGNLLSGIMSVVNFLLLCLTVQKAVNSGDEKYAKTLMKSSQSLRLLMMGVVVGIGAIFDCFNLWATIIPVFFPRLALIIRGIVLRRQGGNGDECSNGSNIESNNGSEDANDTDE